MKKRTVDILDQARDMELKLNWQLFSIEQDSRLWGNGTDEWTPGDPMYIDPRTLTALWWGDVEVTETESPFQYVRDMLEVHYDTTLLEDFYYDNLVYQETWYGCRICDVLWVSSDGPANNCWCCGGKATSANDMYSPEYITEGQELQKEG